MTIIQSVLLGIVQGITEFFPISSSAHLIAIRYLFNFSSAAMGNLTFDIALHFGTLLAVGIYFFKDFILMFKEGFKFKKEGSFSFKNLSKNGKLLWYIIIGCIPAALFGLLFNDIVDEYIRESMHAPLIIAFCLAIMGILLYIADKFASSEKNIEQITLKESIIIGIGQMLAIVPGFSRSGTTMTAARYMKLNKETAAKFSFLLGAPAILGAAIFGFKDIIKMEIDVSFIIGVIVSFLVGLVAIRVLIKIVKKVGFGWFAIYRFVLAIILVTVYLVR